MIEELTEEIGALDCELLAWHIGNAASQWLAAIPGIGMSNAIAIAATVTYPEQFYLSQWFAVLCRKHAFGVTLGLSPWQRTTVGRERLDRISNQGDRYIRTLMVHGASAVLGKAGGNQDARSQWIVRMRERRQPTVVAVALANKSARIVWSILSRGEDYRPARMAAAA